MTIVTERVDPPIPIRSFDWRAWFSDMDPETCACGWGATEGAAIAHLKEIYGIECRQCGRHANDVASCGVGGCPIGADL